MSQTANSIAALGMFLLIGGGGVQAASFDCSKARTTPERMICGNSQLSELDDQLATAYKNAVQTALSPERLRSEQGKWIAHRNECTTVDCLVREYRDRTAALSTGAPSQMQAASNPQRWNTGDNATMSVLNHLIFTSTRMTFAHGTYLDMELIGTGRVTDDLAGTPGGTVQADIYRITHPSNPLLDNGRDHLCAKPITFLAIWEPELARQGGYGPNREVEYYTDPLPPTVQTPRCGVSTFDAPK